MKHLETIYRSFDIRGMFGEELTLEEVEKIGAVMVKQFSTKKVAIGRDVRPSADDMFAALARGICSEGCAVIDLGVVTTPMTYFFGGRADVDATVMITASHMPSSYNGLKITIEDVKPVSSDMLQIMREIVGTHTFSAEAVITNITTHSLQNEWVAHFKNRIDLGSSNFSVVIDPANMVGALEIDTFKAFPQLTVHAIYDELDHTCPNHEANPVKHDTLQDLGREVVATASDIGIAFDGDADRVGIVDERGVPVASDIIGILLAKKLLADQPGVHIVYDVRSTRALKEIIEENGGSCEREKVGHTHIRAKMRLQKSVLGIELSGHFFFQEANYSEGGPLPALLILELLKESSKPLSQLVAEVSRYHQSGEINSTIVSDPTAIFTTLQATFPTAQFDTLDGLSIDTPTWWCNIRLSANDPVMRLNLEAVTPKECEEKTKEILAIIRT